MFYSHEILTSKKYGVATVWLVATLGSRSTAKKVSRKAILDVDVPKACETVIRPNAPLALRLQGNLLFGISRVYQQQCGYVLQDAQHAQDAIKALSLVINTSNIDLPQERQGVRPEQLNLQDDPNFLPDFAFPALESDATLLDLSSYNTVYSPKASQSGDYGSASVETHRKFPLAFPSSDDNSGPGALEGFEASPVLAPQVNDLIPSRAGEEFLTMPDFTFDAEGNICDLNDPPAPVVIGSDHQEDLKFDLEQMINSESLLIHQPQQVLDEEFPYHGLTEVQTTTSPLTPLEEIDTRSFSPSPLQAGSNSPLLATLQRRRMRKVLSADVKTELSYSEVQAWSSHYRKNMKQAAPKKYRARRNELARTNAYQWIFGTTAGDFPQTTQRGGHIIPSVALGGANLFGHLIPRTESSRNEKRRPESDESMNDGPARRVRQRLSSAEASRAEDNHMSDVVDQPLSLQHQGLSTHNMGFDVELPRELETPLVDRSSLMPWNTTASLRGSSIAPGGSWKGSAGGVRSVSRRSSRLVSASPLYRHDTRLVAQELDLHDVQSIGSNDLGMPFGLDPSSDEFEFYGPAVNVNTQTAAESQWQRDTLDEESHNFLSFIEHTLQNRIEGATDTREPGRGVAFEELLPPQTNSNIVAAQGLLHVLSLATKHLLYVEQEVAFGEMILTPIAPAAVAAQTLQVVAPS